MPELIQVETLSMMQQYPFLAFNHSSANTSIVSTCGVASHVWPTESVYRLDPSTYYGYQLTVEKASQNLCFSSSYPFIDILLSLDISARKITKRRLKIIKKVFDEMRACSKQEEILGFDHNDVEASWHLWLACLFFSQKRSVVWALGTIFTLLLYKWLPINKLMEKVMRLHKYCGSKSSIYLSANSHVANLSNPTNDSKLNEHDENMELLECTLNGQSQQGVALNERHLADLIAVLLYLLRISMMVYDNLLCNLVHLNLTNDRNHYYTTHDMSPNDENRSSHPDHGNHRENDREDHRNGGDDSRGKTNRNPSHKNGGDGNANDKDNKEDNNRDKNKKDNPNDKDKKGSNTMTKVKKDGKNAVDDDHLNYHHDKINQYEGSQADRPQLRKNNNDYDRQEINSLNEPDSSCFAISNDHDPSKFVLNAKTLKKKKKNSLNQSTPSKSATSNAITSEELALKDHASRLHSKPLLFSTLTMTNSGSRHVHDSPVTALFDLSKADWIKVTTTLERKGTLRRNQSHGHISSRHSLISSSKIGSNQSSSSIQDPLKANLASSSIIDSPLLYSDDTRRQYAERRNKSEPKSLTYRINSSVKPSSRSSKVESHFQTTKKTDVITKEATSNSPSAIPSTIANLFVPLTSKDPQPVHQQSSPLSSSNPEPSSPGTAASSSYLLNNSMVNNQSSQHILDKKSQIESSDFLAKSSQVASFTSEEPPTLDPISSSTDSHTPKSTTSSPRPSRSSNLAYSKNLNLIADPLNSTSHSNMMTIHSPSGSCPIGRDLSPSCSQGASSFQFNSPSSVTTETKPPSLLSAFGVSASLNKSGLQRAKKVVLVSGKKRTYQMEDIHFCSYPWRSPNTALFCVFDGHSGKSCALSAQHLLPKSLAKSLMNVDLNIGDNGKPGEARNLDHLLNQSFFQVDEQLSKFEYEGTTCTTIIMWQNDVGRRFFQVANVGDSSAFLIRSHQSIQLTEDHHPHSPLERERIHAMGIELHEGQTRLNGLAVSRALGDHFPKSVQCGLIADPSISPVFEISDQDELIILATDGLWDVLSSQESYDIIKDLSSPSAMTEMLLNVAVKSSKCTDNVTIIVIKL